MSEGHFLIQKYTPLQGKLNSRSSILSSSTLTGDGIFLLPHKYHETVYLFCYITFHINNNSISIIEDY